MSLKPGTCSTCHGPTWRSVPHPITSVPLILWPDPTSVYAVYAVEPDGTMAGIGFCRDCAPSVGDGPIGPLKAACPSVGNVVRLETAAERFPALYQDARGVFLRAWLREQHCDPAPVLAQWEADRAMEAAT